MVTLWQNLDRNGGVIMDLSKELQLIAAIYNAMQLVEVRGESNCQNHLWCMQQIKQLSTSIVESQEKFVSEIRRSAAPLMECAQDEDVVHASSRGDSNE